MKFENLLVASIVLFSFSACSGGSGDSSGDGTGGGDGTGSGVAASKRISDLTPDEAMEICAWAAAEQGGENLVFTCPDETTVETGSVDECVSQMAAWPECDATVESLEACGLAIADDACNSFTTSGCQALIACTSF